MPLHKKKFLICCQGDAIEPEEHHPAVPKEDIEKMNHFIEQGVPFEEALLQLRRTHFPTNYDPHPWKTGKSNTFSCSKNAQTYEHIISGFNLIKFLLTRCLPCSSKKSVLKCLYYDLKICFKSTFHF